jgi:hypothetical protein
MDCPSADQWIANCSERCKSGENNCMKEANRNKPGNLERRTLRDVSDEGSTQTIIHFESGRQALEKARLEEQQSRAMLVEHRPSQRRQPEDWLEFSLMIALFFALLLGLYLGLIGSWGF